MAELSNQRVSSPKKVGILTFVFKYGLLGWGLGAGVAYMAMEWMRQVPNLGAQLLWALWFFPALGMTAGLMMWVLAKVFKR